MGQLADWGGLSRAMAASAKRWLCACPAEGCSGAICAYGQECEVCLRERFALVHRVRQEGVPTWHAAHAVQHMRGKEPVRAIV